jgi:hypothetical protein
MRRARAGLALLAVLAGIAGCGGPAGSQAVSTQAPASTGSQAVTAQAPAAAESATAPQPAGNSPSSISRMVCAPKAVAEIADVMGAKAELTPPTWGDHLYSCGFRYTVGTMVLSVKELSSWSQTYGYFDQLASTMHETTPIKQLGQGAFITNNGSVVVRKDWKVLLVNITGVHGEVGSPPKPPGELAIYVAQTILGCWAGDLSGHSVIRGTVLSRHRGTKVP